MRDEIHARDSRVCEISLHGLSQLDSTILNRAAHCHRCAMALEVIGTRLDDEVGKRDLVWVSVQNRWHAEEFSLDFYLGDVQLKVATVVDFRPLQLSVGSDESFAGINRRCKSNILAIWRLRRYGSACELNTDRTGAGR
jgi:hypothetical protein